MNPNEEKLIKDLRLHSNDHSPTLVPHPWLKDKFQPTFFYLDGHADLLLTVRALLYLSMRAINPDLGSDDIMDRNEEEFIHQAMTIANRLMPVGEEALMDHLNLFYREEKRAEEED
ncbi:hypothetical protein K1F50_14550 [Muricauda oceani]|uniref:Uncharacterized protein n=1 Tax=Flagellimonas oceani TaxID=2698672 RepID=A0A6G7J2A3_9FLAO|nr:hypothetical protein [Allomuricauda oceani]MBW8244025.1 hypothetical protein [Allomuricauda oceani]QII45001.1 hypothetical protein GVT53_10010 [Allomuricauda oceani]